MHRTPWKTTTRAQHSSSELVIECILWQFLICRRAWDFFDSADPTNGYVAYQNQEAAMSQGLAKVDSNGTIVIGVDSTTTLTQDQLNNGQYRSS